MNHPKMLTVALIAAIIASLGTLPYAYRFPITLGFHNTKLLLIVCVPFVLSAMLANIALGAYSLISIVENKSAFNQIILSFFCFISGIPLGFIAFAGYKNSLPFTLNLITSIGVVIVNSAIAYTAINNLAINIQKLFSLKLRDIYISQIIVRASAFIIGLMVSLTTCMAAIDGITNIGLKHANLNMINNLSYILGIFIWLPYAALFSNSVQTVAGESLSFLQTKSTNNSRNLDTFTWMILIVSFLSGSALAQTALEFFSPNKHIPVFFKIPIMQSIEVYLLVPLTFISSAIVNYLALIRLKKQFLASLNNHHI